MPKHVGTIHQKEHLGAVLGRGGGNGPQKAVAAALRPVGNVVLAAAIGLSAQHLGNVRSRHAPWGRKAKY